MKEVFLWVFIYIPIAVSIISFVLPIVLMCFGLFWEWLTGLFKQQEKTTQNKELNSNKQTNKIDKPYYENKKNGVIPTIITLFVAFLCVAIGLICSNHQTSNKNFKKSTFSQNDIVSQKYKNTPNNSKFYVDVSKITTEAELKQNMKDVYNTCVKVNLAQETSSEVDIPLFCECFVANFFYNLNSYGIYYTLEYFSKHSKPEVDNLIKFNRGQKGFVLKSLMPVYKQHLITNKVLETQRDIATFACFREISEDEDLWLDTDTMADNLDSIKPDDEKLSKKTNEELINSKEYEALMQRNMIFTYNSCFKNIPIQDFKGFPENFNKKLCHCYTKTYFYFIPGVLFPGILTNYNNMKKLSDTELGRNFSKISSFSEFDTLMKSDSFKSDNKLKSNPIAKKIEIVQLTAMGGCMQGIMPDFFFDTDAIIRELFDENDTE